ncbi:hypothetical protein HAX54_014254 [Datura stramonium]|uniref:Uncharacterized protein n=1 Tax=Datura stramonium TaxID=4076 RepID=A0ABS8TNR9_DATST|nr:hypothetical protein [Datura stramonium]
MSQACLLWQAVSGGCVRAQAGFCQAAVSGRRHAFKGASGMRLGCPKVLSCPAFGSDHGQLVVSVHVRGVTAQIATITVVDSLLPLLIVFAVLRGSVAVAFAVTTPIEGRLASVLFSFCLGSARPSGVLLRLGAF